jgi:hypothetical protein
LIPWRQLRPKLRVARNLIFESLTGASTLVWNEGYFVYAILDTN